ncbi:MAG: PIN domain-containing protein [Terriglobia bacterium]
MVLVDTSVWIEYLQHANPAVETGMDELLLAGEVATTGLVLAELRRGCRTPAQTKVVLQAMEPLDYLEATRAAWLHAGEIAMEGAIRGYRLELGDCLLAAISIQADCALFTLDQDFRRIPGVVFYRSRTP